MSMGNLEKINLEKEHIFLILPKKKIDLAVLVVK